MANILRMGFEVLLIMSLPAILAEQNYGAAPEDATEEEKAALRQAKIDFYNEKSDEMLQYAVDRQVMPKWVASIVGQLKGVLSKWIVELANYHRFFGHNGNPPLAGL